MAIATNFAAHSAASTTSPAASLALGVWSLTGGNDTYLVVALDSTSSSVTSVVNSVPGDTWAFVGAKNGTGIRIEIWQVHAAASRVSNTITINVSPNCNISGCCQEYSGVSSLGTVSSGSSGSDWTPRDTLNPQDGDNFILLGAAVACQSGDTFTAFGANLNLSSVPAATAAASAFCDTTSAAGTAGIMPVTELVNLNNSRNWAAIAFELRSGGSAVGIQNFAETTAPELQTNILPQFSNPDRAFTVLNVKTVTRLAYSFGNPVPVAADLKGGTVGASYMEVIDVEGGTAPFTFAVTDGALPTGTTLNTSTGIISGTPTTLGTYTFTITVTDWHLLTGSYEFSIIIGTDSTGGSYIILG